MTLLKLIICDKCNKKVTQDMDDMAPIGWATMFDDKHLCQQCIDRFIEEVKKPQDEIELAWWRC